MNDLLEIFFEFNEQHRLFKKGDALGLAISGGVDSMVMLHLFLQIREIWELDLYGLHLNHQLRGEDADADADFVKKICKQKNIKCIDFQKDVSAIAEKNKLSVETAARQVRYRFFDQVAEKFNLKIATAHHANDQAETLLDRILRSTGVNGLQGILPIRGKYIRPLLFASRDAIENYATQHDITYRTDASNEDQTFKRNRIRHSLIPFLQQYNPQVITALNRLATSAQETTEYLDRQTEKAFKACLERKTQNEIVLDIENFFMYLTSLQRLMLRRSLEMLGCDTQLLNTHRFSEIDSFLRKRNSGKPLAISDELTLLISGNELIIYKKELQPSNLVIQPGQSVLLWRNIRFSVLEEQPPDTFAQSRSVEWIDAECLREPLLVRTVQDGDFFFPVNGLGRKKVSDFFIDAKIPVFNRKWIPILCSGDDIVWICGYRLDDRFKVTEKTSKYFKLEVTSEKIKSL